MTIRAAGPILNVPATKSPRVVCHHCEKSVGLRNGTLARHGRVTPDQIAARVAYPRGRVEEHSVAMSLFSWTVPGRRAAWRPPAMTAAETLTADLHDCTWIHGRTGQEISEGHTIPAGTKITKISERESFAGPVFRFVAHLDDAREVYEVYADLLPIA